VGDAEGVGGEGSVGFKHPCAIGAEDVGFCAVDFISGFVVAECVKLGLEGVLGRRFHEGDCAALTRLDIQDEKVGGRGVPHGLTVVVMSFSRRRGYGFGLAGGDIFEENGAVFHPGMPFFVRGEPGVFVRFSGLLGGFIFGVWGGFGYG